MLEFEPIGLTYTWTPSFAFMAVEGVKLAVEPWLPYRTKCKLRDLINKMSWTFDCQLINSHCVELG